MSDTRLPAFIKYRKSINNMVERGVFADTADIVLQAIKDKQYREVDYRVSYGLRENSADFSQSLARKISGEENISYLFDSLSTTSAIELYKASFSEFLKQSMKTLSCGLPVHLSQFDLMVFESARKHITDFARNPYSTDFVEKFMFETFIMWTMNKDAPGDCFSKELGEFIRTVNDNTDKFDHIDGTRLVAKLSANIRALMELKFNSKEALEYKMKAVILNHHFVESHLNIDGDHRFANIMSACAALNNNHYKVVDKDLKDEFERTIAFSLKCLDTTLSSRPDVAKKFIGSDMAILYVESFINLLSREFVSQEQKKSLESKFMRTFIGMRQFKEISMSTVCADVLSRVKYCVDWSAIVPKLKPDDIENLKRADVEVGLFSNSLNRKQSRRSLESDMGL